MDIIKKAKDLAQLLIQMHEATLSLRASADEKEKSLRDDDLKKLKEIVEHEEEIINSSNQLDEKRIALTVELAQALGLSEEGVSLRQIAQAIDDEDTKNELLQIGEKLNETITALRDKNDLLTGIISLKSDYADAILQALTVGRETARHYNASGALNDAPDDQAGVVEFFA